MFSSSSRPSSAMQVSLHAAVLEDRQTLEMVLAKAPDVDVEDAEGRTALCIACQHGKLEAVQVLSSYGARRRHIGCGMFAEEAAASADVLSWLIQSRFWMSPLHHVDVISPERTQLLLRAGAKLHARMKYYSPARAPTPLDLAAQSTSEAAALIREAGEPWSPRSHRLWPAPTRAHAASLVQIGHELWRRHMGEHPCGAFLDAWLSHVMPLALDRDEKLRARPRFRRRVSKEHRCS